MTVAEVRLWGRTIGAVSWDGDRGFAHFEYDPAFIPGGRQVAPLTMPLASGIYSFPALSRQTFHGLPGLLADSLPDRFGNALIDAWLVRRGRDPGDFNAVERLCYIGARGMGALDRAGRWSLSPAFDVTYSYNPAGRWTGAHQMTLNGKRDGFEGDDLVACGRNAALKRGRATAILSEVGQAVSRWRDFAEEAGVPGETTRRIGAVHRTDLLP